MVNRGRCWADSIVVSISLLQWQVSSVNKVTSYMYEIWGSHISADFSVGLGGGTYFEMPLNGYGVNEGHVSVEMPVFMTFVHLFNKYFSNWNNSFQTLLIVTLLFFCDCMKLSIFFVFPLCLTRCQNIAVCFCYRYGCNQVIMQVVISPFMVMRVTMQITLVHA